MSPHLTLLQLNQLTHQTTDCNLHHDDDDDDDDDDGGDHDDVKQHSKKAMAISFHWLIAKDKFNEL